MQNQDGSIVEYRILKHCSQKMSWSSVFIVPIFMQFVKICQIIHSAWLKTLIMAESIPLKCLQFYWKTRLKMLIFSWKLILDFPYNFLNAVPNKLFLLWWTYSNRCKAAGLVHPTQFFTAVTRWLQKLILGRCGSCCLMLVISCVCTCFQHSWTTVHKTINWPMIFPMQITSIHLHVMISHKCPAAYRARKYFKVLLQCLLTTCNNTSIIIVSPNANSQQPCHICCKNVTVSSST
jgi:hypothetical protein